MDVFVPDQASQSGVRRLPAEVLNRLSRVDVLVNNAGGTGPPAMSPLTGSNGPSP